MSKSPERNAAQPLNEVESHLIFLMRNNERMLRAEAAVQRANELVRRTKMLIERSNKLLTF